MERYGSVILYLVIVFIILFLSKKIADLLTRFDDDLAIDREGNLAVGLRRFGLYTGICIALVGIMSEGTSLRNILNFCLSGALVIVLFFATYYINDYVILRGVRNNELVKLGNIPTGLVEAGGFIATGILLNGAFTGEGGGIASAIVFFLLGQTIMVLALTIHQKMYSFNIVEEVKDGNTGAGISVAGILVSYSIILRSSIAGNFIGWAAGLGSFLLSAFTGIIALLVFQKLADIIFLPKTTITEGIKNRNTASLVLVQGITLSLSLAISRLISF